MTGGQMAPTTLMNQKTQTSPNGRRRLDGQPMKIAELMALLDGPVYVERVALYDAKHRVKTKKAIKKALQLQVENKGFSFVEILSECPTHLKMTPTETEKWVKECMEPVFPIGVKKDLTGDPWFHLPKPQFDPKRMVEILHAEEEVVQSFAKNFPTHIDPVDIALKFAGAGGDGAQTAAMLVTQSAIYEKYDGTHIPSYGPESRGGTSYADVHVAKDQVLSPSSAQPHILVVFNAPSLTKFAPTVVAGGYIIYDSSIIKEAPEVAANVKMIGVPFTQIAMDLGKKMVKNIVALGALQAATNIFPKETFLNTIRKALADKAAMIPINEQAFDLGAKAVTPVETHA
jgi:2-oxoisovalerate ferredoxin oxidoreductase beta subunit